MKLRAAPHRTWHDGAQSGSIAWSRSASHSNQDPFKSSPRLILIDIRELTATNNCAAAGRDIFSKFVRSQSIARKPRHHVDFDRECAVRVAIGACSCSCGSWRCTTHARVTMLASGREDVIIVSTCVCAVLSYVARLICSWWRLALLVLVVAARATSRVGACGGPAC